MKPEANKPEKRLAKDLIPVDEVEISGHALMQFQIRTGSSLIEATKQIRTRLTDAYFIEKHPTVNIYSNRKNREGNRGMFFQDPEDDNIVYVVYEEKRGHFVLASAIKPLRKK